MDREELIESALAGDRRAFNSLTRYLQPRLRRFFKHKYRDLDADELVQHTLTVISLRLPDFEMRGEAAFNAWVLDIARKSARTVIRKLPRPFTPVVAPAAGPGTVLERIEQIEQIRAAADSLPPSLRRVAHNILADGDTRELADEMGLEWSTVRAYKTRAIKLLRGRLQPDTPQ
jgi:RNA polymerase sigma factor (sigma-70 family)